MEKKDLEAAFRAKLKESGISIALAKKLGLELFTAAEAGKELPGLPCYRGGFRIPYYNLDGQRTDSYRFRYLEPETGMRAITGNGLRYAQPKGTPPAVYLPAEVPWLKIAPNPAIPIYITEGELKAVCGANNALPVIGLGGVYMFADRRNGDSLLPELRKIKWPTRPVYICFDSDASTKPQVRRAESALARALMNAGANPFIVRIPPVKANGKTGLDDFLIVPGGKAALEELIKEATPYSAAKELHRLNEEVVYIKNPPTGIIVRLEDLADMSAYSFKEHVYSNRSYIERAVDGKEKVRWTAAEWLRWQHRAEVEGITYAPGEPLFTSTNELNKWRGWGCEPKKGNIKRLLTCSITLQPA